MAVAIAVAVAAARPAQAADTFGGVEPSFFEGAGIRALGMGGAFTAVADDASSPRGTPRHRARPSRPVPGLAHESVRHRVQRAVASVVLPSWRYAWAR